MIQRIKTLYEKYERRFSSLAFLAGFVWDNLTLTRVDLWLDNLILLWYLFLASLGILAINAYEAGRWRHNVFAKTAKFFPLAVQFAFGGIFSGFFVFYSRSASLITSWPFLSLLFFLLIGNEFFRERYSRFTFQLSIFFTALFSYAIFAVPVITRKMGADIFILSGLFSLAVVAFIALLLFWTSPARFRHSRKMLFISIGAIYFTFNFLYFADIIPPLPLTLKEAGVYHAVTRLPGGEYEVSSEPVPWYVIFQEQQNTFHRFGDSPVYVYTSIFAPTKLNAKILHRWSYYDEKKGDWRETDQMGFAITGGRDGGYRGFTFKQNLNPGFWQVEVIAERGQTLGKIRFKLEEVNSPPELNAFRR